MYNTSCYNYTAKVHGTYQLTSVPKLYTLIEPSIILLKQSLFSTNSYTTRIATHNSMSSDNNYDKCLCKVQYM